MSITVALVAPGAYPVSFRLDATLACDDHVEKAKELIAGQSGESEVIYVSKLEYYEVHFPVVRGDFKVETKKMPRATGPVKTKVAEKPQDESKTADADKPPYDLRTKEGKDWLKTKAGQTWKAAQDKRKA